MEKHKHNGFNHGVLVLCETDDEQFDWWASSSCTHCTDPEVSVNWNTENWRVTVESVDNSEDPAAVALGMAITSLMESGYNGYGIAKKLSEQGFLRRVTAAELKEVTVRIDDEVVTHRANLNPIN